MAGTATIHNYVSIDSLGSVPKLLGDYTITGVDEASYQYRELAAEGVEAIVVGSIDTVTGFWIKLITGGATVAAGLDIHLASATWADQDYNIIIIPGQSQLLIPQLSTLSVKNLSTDTTAVYEYVIFGDNA